MIYFFDEYWINAVRMLFYKSTIEERNSIMRFCQKIAHKQANGVELTDEEKLAKKTLNELLAAFRQQLLNEESQKATVVEDKDLEIHVKKWMSSL